MKKFKLKPKGSKKQYGDTTKSIDKSKKFYDDYYNSFQYRKRLGSDTETQKQESLKYLDELSFYDESVENLRKLSGARSDQTAQGISMGNGDIVFNKDLAGRELEDVLSHEISHATEPYTNDDAIKQYKISKEYENSDEYIDYISQPTEQRARLFNLHYNAKQEGINDISKGEQFNKEKLEKFKENPQYQDLFLLHDENTIIKMLNEIAYNPSEGKKYTNAQFGQSTYIQKPLLNKVDTSQVVNNLADDPDVLRQLNGKDEYYAADVKHILQKDAKVDQKYSERYNIADDKLIIKDSKYNIRNNQRVNKNVAADIVIAAKKSGVDPYLALSIAQRESGIGDNYIFNYEEGLTNPSSYFNNYAANDFNLNKEEQESIDFDLLKYQAYNEKDISDLGKTIPTKIYKKILDKAKSSEKFPFASEIETIKERGISNYNPGDPDYANKVAKEKEIIMAPENQGFRNYVDSVYTSKNQYGGKSPVLAEKGEVYEDEFGNILRVPTNSPSHEDDDVMLANGMKVPTKKGEGGHIIDNSESVLSASYEQVKSGKRKKDIKEEVVAFNPDDLEEISNYLGVKLKRKSTMSPSKAFEIFKKENDKKKFKFQKKNEREDKFSQNSQMLNQQQSLLLPEDDDIYDLLHRFQEAKKESSGIDFEEKAQFGKFNLMDSIKQSGGLRGLKLKVGEKEADDFYDEYYNSDEYQKRLKENGVQNTVAERDYSLNALENTKVQGVTAQRTKIDTGTFDTRAYTDPKQKVVYVNENAQNPSSSIIHEYSHTTEPRSTNSSISKIPKTLDPKIVADPAGKKYINYVGKPTEQRARLFQLHKEAKDSNINNLIEGDKFDQNKLNRLNKNVSLQELRAIHSDEEIIEMLNTIAYEDNDDYSDIQPAQYGTTAKAFHKDYYNSDEYKKRLIANGATNPDEEVSNSLNRLDNTKVDMLSGNEMRKRTQAGVNGYALQNSNEIYVKENAPDVNGILTHEYSHTTEPSTTSTTISGYSDQRKLGYKKYVSDPSEQRARLFDIHEKARRNGINDLVKGEKFDQKKLDKFKRNNVYQELKTVNDDETIIKMLNEVAYNDNDYQDYKAQYGVPVSLNGVHEFPGQEVIVPSSSISMSGVPYEIDAFDADTNKYLETMKPGRNYNFKGVNNVREKPVQSSIRKMQVGGTNDEWNEPINTNESGPTRYRLSQTDQNSQHTVREGEWFSSILDTYGIMNEMEDIKVANPHIRDFNNLKPGDKLNLPAGFSDLSDNEYKPETPRPREANIVELNITPTTVKPLPRDLQLPELDYSKLPGDTKPEDNIDLGEDFDVNSLKDKSKKNTDFSYGKLQRNIPTNTLQAMKIANRELLLPYRPEVPNRILQYVEEDVRPYLDEIDSQINVALETVNPNTAQGMSIMTNLLSTAAKQKRDVQNRVNSINLQRRVQTENANNQQMNQSDLLQEQSNQNYVGQTQQAIANRDKLKVQEAQYLDELIVNEQRANNFAVLESAKYANFRNDPKTGEVYRVETKLPSKGKYGIKKRK